MTPKLLPLRRRGLGWGDDDEEQRSPARPLLVLLLGLALIFSMVPSIAAFEAGAESSWIVRAQPGLVAEAERVLERVGGQLVLPLPIIGGFSAQLTPTEAQQLSDHASVAAVTPDSSVTFTTWRSGPPADEGSMHVITNQVLHAAQLWQQGITGKGIDIALIDSGIAPVDGLNGPGKVVHGPDISFDSQMDNLRYLDLFGHGTHMASIIAGDELDGRTPRAADLRTAYLGVAPGARIVNVKVADGAGRADVSQIIAAIDWVVQHQTDGELNIRVLALAFGTDSTQDYEIDPITHAAEVAWRNGLVVVAAAGNDGNASPLRNPALDPYLISVGAVSTNGTYGSGDDKVLTFSNCGTPERSVDLLAPGKSVLGLRVPNSFIDYHFPEGAVGDRLFRGSGTSQAVAVTAGAVALLLDQRPELTPDQVKAMLKNTAAPLRNAPGECANAGTIDLLAASRVETPSGATQSWPTSTGLGSLDQARGSFHVSNPDATTLTGEVDIFGTLWDGSIWAPAAEALSTWNDGVWMGNAWTGSGWTSNSWSSNSWSSNSWSSNSWSSNSWSSNSWSSNSWSTAAWESNSWSSNSWSSNSWSSNSWSGSMWTTSAWK